MVLDIEGKNNRWCTIGGPLAATHPFVYDSSVSRARIVDTIGHLKYRETLELPAHLDERVHILISIIDGSLKSRKWHGVSPEYLKQRAPVARNARAFHDLLGNSKQLSSVTATCC